MRAGIAWSYDLLSPTGAGPVPATGGVRRRVHPCGRRVRLVAGTGRARLETVRRWSTRVCCSRRPRRATTLASRCWRRCASSPSKQLAAHGEEDAARRAHAAYFGVLAQAAEPGLRGVDQQQWRDRLENDLDNLRAALSWATSDSACAEDAASGLRLAGALWYFWFQRGLTGEGRRWLMQTLAGTPERGSDAAQALLGAGTLAWRQGDFVAARTHLDQSVTLWRDDNRPARPRGGSARARPRPVRPTRLRRRPRAV